MKIKTKFFAVIFFASSLSACSMHTPSDVDLANFPNQAEYTVSDIELESSLCNLVSREEIGSLLEMAVESEANPMLTKNPSIKECHYFNRENNFTGVAIIANLDNEKQSAKEMYQKAVENSRNVLKITTTELTGVGEQAVYYSPNANSTTIDALKNDIWLNLSISGDQENQRLEKGKQIANLVFDSLANQ